MKVTLLATEEAVLRDVESYLNGQQREVAARLLDAAFFAVKSTDTGLFFLILQEQDLIKAGELAARVRGALAPSSRLILCMPQPIHREALLGVGADDIITPAKKSASDIAERLLSQLIRDGEVPRDSYGKLRGATTVMHALYDQIEVIASLHLDAVLILGDSGSGKELVAHELHERSPRSSSGALIAVNVAEFSPTLIESELFGHKKGSFTGADRDRKGLLEMGKGSTIFLDEIGELDQSLQAKLLRVLEQKKIRPLGSNDSVNIDVRFIFATNRNLDEECDAGRFKRDLLARIRELTLEVPPLRLRKADIPLLCDHFLREFSSNYGRGLRIPSGALDCLFQYDWPDNVRELRGAIRKAAGFANEASEISAVILHEMTRGRKRTYLKNNIEFDPSVHTWPEIYKIAKYTYFRAILTEANGNRGIAMKLSGLSKAQFYQILKELDLM